MLVLVRWQARTMAVPLSQLAAIDPDDASTIAYWHYCLAMAYLFLTYARQPKTIFRLNGALAGESTRMAPGGLLHPILPVRFGKAGELPSGAPHRPKFREFVKDDWVLQRLPRDRPTSARNYRFGLVLASFLSVNGRVLPSCVRRVQRKGDD
jgi:hypothetical protein